MDMKCLNQLKKLGEYGAMDEALVNYIKQFPNGIVGEEYAAEQGRITMYNEAVEDDENQDSPEEGTEEDKDEDSIEEDTEEDKDEDSIEEGTEEDKDEDSIEEGTEEDKEEDSIEEGAEEDKYEDSAEEDKNRATGDKNMISAYVVMLVISMSVLGAVVINRKKVINKE